MEKTEETSRIEVMSSTSDEQRSRGPRVVGNVQLIRNNETVLVPTPSPDPKDPLNLPPWRKWGVLTCVAAYGCTAVVLASGLGPIFTAVVASYPGQELRANDLLTYPTLFMGIGNLIGMPMSQAIGRRPIFIFAIVLMIAGGIWCAYAPDLGNHIAGRNVMALAAGQSEALAPLMVQEIHFLHERGRKLAWFVAIETIATAVFFIVSTYITNSWGWRWWYKFFTIANGLVLLVSFFLVAETDFDRPEDATTGEVHLHFNKQGDVEKNGEQEILVRVTTAHGNVLQPERFGKRTWKHDLKLVALKPRWHLILPFYRDFLQGLCIPSMVWLLLLNGAFLGLYVFQAGTFATVLIPPPYGFSFNSLGYVQAGQIVDCLIFLPLLGYGSDFVIKLLSKRNKGLFKPEYRLIGISIPATVGVVCAIIYGQSAQWAADTLKHQPAGHAWHWSAVVISYTGDFFAFLGANLVGLTYAIESFPNRAASMLAVICVGRGFISFGLSYATLPSISAIGYDGAMNVQGGIAGGLALMAIPMYLMGHKIRGLASKWFGMGGDPA